MWLSLCVNVCCVCVCVCAAGSLSTFVEELVIVSASGTVIICSRSLNTEVFEAARLGLGAVGVIVQVTLRTAPLFGVRSRQYLMDTDLAIASVMDFARQHEFFKARPPVL